MKIGCCLNMIAADKEKTGMENIPLIASLGYDYIEVPLSNIMALPESKRREVSDFIKSAGIPAEACNNFFPPSVRLTGPEAKMPVILEYAARACAWAAETGVEIIVLGSSGAKNIPEAFPYDKAAAQLEELLHHLQGIAAPLGITIVLEPLNREESNFVITAEEALGIVLQAGEDNIKLLIDYYHMRMENENPSIVQEAAGYLYHTHIAAKNGRTLPKAGDGEDYGDFISRLKKAGYDRRISVEGFSNNVASDLEASLALFRSLLLEEPV
ncbi:sugar phosphate isomerase/epimerase [Treponema sp. OttesenSCG-928-L16]|nr:sugar phosphate isomerase/epimerase [Treponema sp. OttesenSCG-928-L16]